MEFPLELRNTIDIKAAAWKPADLKKTSAAITERYKNESGKGKKLIISELDAVVYSAVRMPATFASVRKALFYALEGSGIDIQEIHTLLDVGAGTGAATWAADEFLELDKIVCLERERAMSTLGAEYMQSGSKALKRAEWISGDLTGNDFHYTADLVTASYVLNELTGEERIKAVKKLWNAAGKMLIITEPGTPEGFRQLKAARDLLIAEGAYLAAPCPHENRCRLAENDWCHFTVRVQRGKLHKMIKGADVPYEDEKFIYMAFVRTRPKIKGARILRHPYIEKGRVTLELCTESENKTETITKAKKELYKAAKKSQCGDLFY